MSAAGGRLIDTQKVTDLAIIVNTAFWRRKDTKTVTGYDKGSCAGVCKACAWDLKYPLLAGPGISPSGWRR